MNSQIFDFNIRKGTHDLRLSNWGSYSRKYAGISHIPDGNSGIRFDLSVFPGFYRRKADVPNVMWESGFHPWESSPDLSYFSNRHELEWKDKVYTDISFSEIDHNSRLIRCDCVNNTDLAQNIVLHYIAYLNFPLFKSKSGVPAYPYQVKLPSGALWIDALDYTDMRYAISRPTDNLVPDGKLRGEVREDSLVGATGLGEGFGQDKGDTVQYRFVLNENMRDAVLLLRYILEDKKEVSFRAEGIINDVIYLKGSGNPDVAVIKTGSLISGEYELKLMSMGGHNVILDGFAVVPSSKIDEVKLKPVEWNYCPEILSCGNNGLLLKYKNLNTYYGIAWAYDMFEIRQFYCSELDRYMRHAVHNHISSIFNGEGEGHYTNIFFRPINIEAGSRKALYGMVCSGSKEEVEKHVLNFNRCSFDYETVYRAAREKINDFSAASQGSEYLFSQQRMAATTLTNLVYPIYTKRSYIKHNSPGRWWDCLYTWDSGFICLGLKELNIDRAIDCLNAYLTEPDDRHAVFIHHGSFVPVQAYAFLEIWNKTRLKEMALFFYPRLKQYYMFMSGKLGSSTTRTLKSNLIKTWDYFYNSGGWDDYPPQVYVHKNMLEKTVAPVINTAHCIRFAKILLMICDELQINEDIDIYTEDINVLSKAILQNCWDEETGYFGYLYHNEKGYPTGILKHESGINFNMGLDGAYPLVAGICTEEQEERLLEHLESEDNLWTKIGISTVDQSAPYYKADGYWNGAVWMPHQWFYWKSMLDLGRGDFAFKIARTGLDVWKREVDETYNCYEHFIIQSGRGAGWHQFSALSTPVLSWFGAYFKPGSLTFGFDVLKVEEEFSEDFAGLDASFRYYGKLNKRFNAVVCMKPEEKYKVTLNDKTVNYHTLLPGTLQLDLELDTCIGVLKINIKSLL